MNHLVFPFKTGNIKIFFFFKYFLFVCFYIVCESCEFLVELHIRRNRHYNFFILKRFHSILREFFISTFNLFIDIADTPVTSDTFSKDFFLIGYNFLKSSITLVINYFFGLTLQRNTPPKFYHNNLQRNIT